MSNEPMNSDRNKFVPTAEPSGGSPEPLKKQLTNRSNGLVSNRVGNTPQKSDGQPQLNQNQSSSRVNVGATTMNQGFDTMLMGAGSSGTLEAMTLLSKENLNNRTNSIEEMDFEDGNDNPYVDEEYETYYSIKALQRVYIKPAVQLEKTTDFSLKDFKIVNLLGQGGFGQVFLVKSLKSKDKQLLALKKIMLCLGNSGNPTMTEQKRLRVMRETQIMETLHHPHIVSMHAHFIDSEVKTEIKKGVEIDEENLKVNLPSEETEEIEKWFLCIVMEHASRGDLLHLIEKHKLAKEPISEEVIWTVCNQIAQGLQYLHSHQVIHRDIKPQNILITGENTFKIGDLGISRSVQSKQQQLLESKIGTPLYACPELVKKQPYDYKIDMWALGCVMHYMACLEHPFLANPVMKGHHFNRQQIEYQILTGTPKSLPEQYSNRLRIVIQRLLEKDSSRRISAQELLNLIPYVPSKDAEGTSQPPTPVEKKNVRFDEGEQLQTTKSGFMVPSSFHTSQIQKKQNIQPILKRLPDQPNPLITVIYNKNPADKQAAAAVPFTMPNSNRRSVLETQNDRNEVQSVRPQDQTVMEHGGDSSSIRQQMMIIDNASSHNVIENIENLPKQIQRSEHRDSNIPDQQKQLFQQLNNRIQYNKKLPASGQGSRKLLQHRLPNYKDVDHENKIIHNSTNEDDDINQRSIIKDISTKDLLQRQASIMNDVQYYQKNKSINFQSLKGHELTQKFGSRMIIGSSQQRDTIEGQRPQTKPLLPSMPMEFSRTAGIKGLQSLPEHIQNYNEETIHIQNSFSQLAPLNPLSPTRMLQKSKQGTYSKFHIKKQQFTDMQVNQNNLAYSDFRNKYAALSKLSSDIMSSESKTTGVGGTTTNFSQSLKSASIQSTYLGKKDTNKVGVQGENQSATVGYSPSKKCLSTPPRQQNIQAFKISSQLSIIENEGKPSVFNDTKRLLFNQSSNIVESNSQSVVIIPAIGHSPQKNAVAFYSPQKIKTNIPSYYTINMKQNHTQKLQQLEGQESITNVGLLSTFQCKQSEQLPNLIEQNHSPINFLKQTPSQESVQLLEGGHSPELHAREFLAMRMHQQKVPPIPIIRPSNSINNSHHQHRLGEQNAFLGLIKRNSNATLTNTSQIVLPPNSILGSGSANIIKPRFDKQGGADTRFSGSSTFLGMTHKFGNLQNSAHKVSNRFTIKDLQ